MHVPAKASSRNGPWLPARRLNLTEVERACSDNLAKEERMQQWLLGNIREITESYLAEEARETAKI